MFKVKPFTKHPTVEQQVETMREIWRAIKNSDDFAIYEDVMVQASYEAVRDGKITVADLQECGGWFRSYQKPGTYFMYVSPGGHVKHRRYLDIKTGRIYK